MHARSDARDDLVSSHNCDRRFHFFKATSHTIAFCTRESAMFFFFFEQPAKARRTCRKRVWNQIHVNRCHISAGTHKFKSAVLVSGVPFQKIEEHWRNSNIFCRVNQAGRAQNYWPVCQNFGVPCPKWMSCKCAFKDPSEVWLQTLFCGHSVT